MSKRSYDELMKRKLIFLALLIAVLFTEHRFLMACTVAVITGTERFMAANYDFAFGHGLILINPRGLVKASLYDREEDRVVWTALYGSVTFNQFGRELPTGGMNEKGLSIELLWQDDARLPPPRKNGNLGELQWIQYQLDTKKDVKEVLNSIKDEKEPGIRISYMPLHYFLCDVNGECAIVEFVNDRVEVFEKNELPVAALSNASYRRSLAFLADLQSRGIRFSDEVSPLGRFSMAAAATSDPGIASDSLEGSFAALKQFSIQPGIGDLFVYLLKGQPPAFTQWSIVYRPQSLRIHFNTRNNPAERRINLNDIDFDCRSGALMHDIEKGSGNLRHKLLPYSQKENERIIRLSYAPVKQLFPEDMQKALSVYPDTFRCAPSGILLKKTQL